MDMLEVGRGLTFEEDKSHFSLWSILSSPLILGTNLTSMSEQTRQILTNQEVIAVNQDTTGLQAHLIYNQNNTQIWAKALNGKISNERAVVLFNRNSVASTITVNWSDINLKGVAQVRDLWAKKDLGRFDNSYSVSVPAHGVSMIKVSGASHSIQRKYEAEYAWINNFNLLQSTVVMADQGRAITSAQCSGGAMAGWLPNIDKIEFDVNDTDTGLGAVNQVGINMFCYPNPVQSTLFIHKPVNYQGAEIYSIDGKLLLKDSKASINLSKLTKGSYLVKMKTNNATVSQQITII